MKYEYKVAAALAGYRDIEIFLNKHGAEGWRLITVTPENEYDHSLIFIEREVPEPKGEQTMELPPFLAMRTVSE